MKIYIRTRWDPNSDTGIYWRSIDSNRNGSFIDDEPKSIDDLESMNIFLSDVKQTIVLWRNKKEYCLLIDNIDSEFKDKANRPVKHAFLFVGQYEYDEAFYRMILYCYLTSCVFPINSFFIKERNHIGFTIVDKCILDEFLSANEEMEYKNNYSFDSFKSVLVNRKLPIPNSDDNWLNLFNKRYCKEPYLIIKENFSKESIEEIRIKFKNCCILNFEKGGK